MYTPSHTSNTRHPKREEIRLQDIQNTQIVGVEGVPTKQGTLRYKVKLATSQEPSCFDVAKATKAQSMIGQLVDVRVEQSGKFVNFVDVAAPGGLPPLAIPAGTPIGLTPIPTAAPVPVAAPYAGDKEKNERIGKMNAAGTAFAFVSSLFTGAGPEALKEAEEQAWALAKRVYENVQPTNGTPVVAVPATPAAVAEQVNEVMGTPAVTTATAVVPTTAGPTW